MNEQSMGANINNNPRRSLIQQLHRMGGNENRKKYITNKIEYLGRGDKESKPRAVAELLSATSNFGGRRRTRRGSQVLLKRA